MGKTRKINELRETLNHKDRYVRHNAAIELANLGEFALTLLMEALHHESGIIRRHHTIQALIQIDEPALPALTQAVAEESQGRVCAAYALYRIDNSKLDILIPTLINAWVDESPYYKPALVAFRLGIGISIVYL